MGFHAAVSYVLEREGGAKITDDAQDPGGLTKYGISQRAYPNLDIRALTLQDAQQLYKRDYWDKIRGDELPDSIAFCLFDGAVNQGVERTIRLLQLALGLTVDGEFGPLTLAAAKNHAGLIEKFQAERILHYASLPTWGKYGRGWARRAIGTAMEANA